MATPWSQVKQQHLEQPAVDSAFRVGLRKSVSSCSPGHGEFCSQEYLDLYSFSQVSSIMGNGRSLSFKTVCVVGSSVTTVSDCR